MSRLKTIVLAASLLTIGLVGSAATAAAYVDDLGPDGHVAAVHLQVPSAIEQLPTTGPFGLVSRQHHGVARIVDLVGQVVDHSTTRRHACDAMGAASGKDVETTIVCRQNGVCAIGV